MHFLFTFVNCIWEVFLKINQMTSCSMFTFTILQESCGQLCRGFISIINKPSHRSIQVQATNVRLFQTHVFFMQIDFVKNWISWISCSRTNFSITTRYCETHVLNMKPQRNISLYLRKLEITFCSPKRCEDRVSNGSAAEKL